MTTPKPSIDLSNLHPVMQQALAPHVHRFQYCGVNYYDQADMQAAMQRDRKAIHEQIKRDETFNNFGATL